MNNGAQLEGAVTNSSRGMIRRAANDEFPPSSSSLFSISFFFFLFLSYFSSLSLLSLSFLSFKRPNDAAQCA